MRKYTFLLGVGIMVFLTPFLGVPESWKAVLLFMLGFCVIGAAFFYRITSRKLEQNEEDIIFTENEPARERAIEF